MTYEEKRRWLSRYGDAMVKAKHLRDDLDEAERDTGCTTQQLTGMPGGGGDGQALPRAVERIEEARQAYKAQCEESARIREEITFALQQLDDETEFNILYRRYLCGDKWERIADRLHLTVSWVFRLHKKAVQHLDTVA